ncbi:restriction endonuclease subunit S [Marivita geojedonensis]|uniref:restriction endonuclease subunit S n=1 Tax=Marivita geojedonensis TaxID=1123756 RepID=UPI000A1D6853|nr:restriction endonuclease subunit S [Marivita geojedonensis]PRY73846.1 type I restriction enzyme S subunit [Marivita geojedonensis]
MNAERLLEVYEKISEAPNAIARLRLFVLDLAVRGKLVEQDAGDEPATQLLKRIEVEKSQIVRDGRFKQYEGTFERKQEEFAFQLPANWHWCYLDDLAAVARGGSPRPIKSYLTDDPNGIPWIKIGDSNRGSIYIDSTVERIKPEGLAKSRLVVPGDLLLSNSMSFGFPYITNVEGCIHDGWLVIRTPEKLISKLFLHALFLSAHAKRSFAEAASGAVVQNLNADKVRQLTVPLPPLAEQHRIVAKVDELMALCDRLEDARKTREEVRDKLTAASLARLTGPDTTPEDFPTHARFALEALPALTTRSDQIKSLRQNILNLAVRGKLVEQEAEDEPASELLEAIAVEQNELAKAGKFKRPKPLPPVDMTLAPFDLPFGWAWARFPELGTFGRGKSQHRPRNDPALYRDGEIPFIQTGDVARSGGRITSNTGFYNEVGLAQSMLWPRGTMCITIAANIADSGILDFDACFPDSVVGLVPASMFDNARYFEYFIRTAKANLLEFAPATAQKNINLGILETVLIPLPPLAEQHRIVAKVDALMALCDRLEASLTNADTTRTRLLEALLQEALEPTASIQETAE